MTELFLHLPTIDEFENIDYYLFPPAQESGTGALSAADTVTPGSRALANAGKLFKKVLLPSLDDGGRFAGLYFGSEFCQRLIPSPDELKKAIDISSAKKLKFALVTPYVTDEGLKSLVKLFEQIEKSGVKTEAVVNDLGVLKILSDNYPGIKPVYGRLMNKMPRMPRLAKRLPENITPGQLRSYQQCSLLLPHYKKFLLDAGVERIEFDAVPQGIKMDFSSEPFKASFYYPWAYITTGRVCEIGSMGLDDYKKFSLSAHCGRECRKYYVHLFREECGCDGNCAHKSAASKYMFQKGNTTFMICEAPPQVLKNLFSQGFDRVIYEPCFPI